MVDRSSARTFDEAIGLNILENHGNAVFLSMNDQLLAHLSKDAKLRKIIKQIPFPKPSSSGDVYFALLRSILSQQLSVKAAATIFNRFIALFPNGYPPTALLMNKDVEVLRGVGLSRQKAIYVKEVATFFDREQPSEDSWSEMDDEAVIQYLTQIKGVGRWTVQMILMSTLQRPDVFPVADLGIRQGMAQLYQLKEEGKALTARLEKIARRWQPYRSYACYYVWRWKDEAF